MNSETQPVSLTFSEHPDETQLLLALEKELSPQETSQVENHLGSCWSCRARSEEMQRGILAFVEYREKRYLPFLPAPPTGFSGLQGGLRTAIAANSGPGRLARLWRWILALLAVPAQMKWVSAVAVAMVGVLLWVEVIHPQTVSANELVTRAIAAQNAAPIAKSDTPVRVAHQKLQIHSGDRTIVRDFEWPVGKEYLRLRWATRIEPLQWNSPLTAAAFGDWRDSLQTKQEAVKRSGNFLTLSTSTGHDWIREAHIVVRATDFHPVEQHFRFSNNRELDLKELAFEISEQAPTPVQPVPAGSSKPEQLAAVEIHTSSLPDLDKLEMELRYLFFTHQWDTGEDFKIEKTGGQLTLSGIVGSPEREKTMRATLTTLPLVRLSLSAPSALSNSTAPRYALPMPASASPDWKDGLEKAFPDREQRLDFVDRCISSSDTAVSHVWALKGLADRYGDGNIRTLPLESRGELLEILRGHLLKARQANHDLDALSNMLPAGNSISTQPAVSWSAGIQSLFVQVQRQDASVARLLVGTQKGAQAPQSTSADFQSAHRRSSILLDSFDQLLSALQ